MNKIPNNFPAILEVTPDNIEHEHICCAIGANKDAKNCANSKKEWMRTVYPEGYRFWKLDVQGKAFLEAIPGQSAWCPIEADNWLFIDCFWISGQYKGKGHSRLLLDTVQNYAAENGFLGLCALAGDKKRPFLSDAAFYRHFGFAVADTAPPFYELLALPLQKGAQPPRFLPVVKQQAKTKGTPTPEDTNNKSSGIEVFYSHHCPHTSRYVPMLQEMANERGVPFTGHKLETAEQARSSPHPFPTYAMFYNGAFVTNEIFSEGKLRKFIEEHAK